MRQQRWVPRRPKPDSEEEPEPTTSELAVELVLRGLRSPLILDDLYELALYRRTRNQEMP